MVRCAPITHRVFATYHLQLLFCYLFFLFLFSLLTSCAQISNFRRCYRIFYEKLYLMRYALSPLISYYTNACIHQENLETFTALVRDFYYCTDPDDYDALHALRNLFPPETDKRKILDFLTAEEERMVREACQPVEFHKKDNERKTLH